MGLDLCRCGDTITYVHFRGLWFSATAADHAAECPLGGAHAPTIAVG